MTDPHTPEVTFKRKGIFTVHDGFCMKRESVKQRVPFFRIGVRTLKTTPLASRKTVSPSPVASTSPSLSSLGITMKSIFTAQCPSVIQKSTPVK